MSVNSRNVRVPALLVLLTLLMAWYNIQAVRMARFDSRLRELQHAQEITIEENKRIMAAREIIRDPERIREIAEQQLGYRLLGVESIIYLDVEQ